MTISRSKATEAIALLPFFYYSSTRLRSLRDVAYLIVTSWIPLIWIGLRLSDLPPIQLLSHLALGYLAFIAIYEIGYLWNDLWDARRKADGRERFGLTLGPAWITTFVAIRLALWTGIALATGWILHASWIAAFATLVVIIAIHNLLNSAGLRLASFAQMAILRFLLPILPIVTDNGLLAVILAATLLYLPLRYLAYADSKGLLVMSDRKLAWFGAAYLLISLPLVSLVAFLTGLLPLVELALFLTIAHAFWSILVAQRSGAKP